MIPEMTRTALSPRGDGNGSRDLDDEEQRIKNNLAVRRSRMKSRQKMTQMVDRCGRLRRENAVLEVKVNALMKELSFLKELFLTHASGKEEISPSDLDRIMTDDLPGPPLPEPLTSQLDSSGEEEELQDRADRLQAGEKILLKGVSA